MKVRYAATSVFLAACLMVYATPLAPIAWAGETLLGVLLASDGGSVNNANTGYGSAGCAPQGSVNGAGACAQAFQVPASTPISIQCSTAASVKVNAPAVDAGDGIRVVADQFLTSSTATTSKFLGPSNLPDAGLITSNGVPDGGWYYGGLVSCSPIAGASTCRCNIYQRQGNE